VVPFRGAIESGARGLHFAPVDWVLRRTTLTRGLRFYGEPSRMGFNVSSDSAMALFALPLASARGTPGDLARRDERVIT
jgi:hypothetical protein